MDTANPTRTYSASSSLAQAYATPQEEAYARQKTHDDENLTLKEKGHQITKTVPVPDIELNPYRTYSADAPLWGLSQMYGPAEDAYATQKGFDNAGITTREIRESPAIHRK